MAKEAKASHVAKWWEWQSLFYLINHIIIHFQPYLNASIQKYLTKNKVSKMGLYHSYQQNVTMNHNEGAVGPLYHQNFLL